MTNDINSFLAMDIPNIGGAFETRTIAPGDFIFLEGQPGDAAYIILRGEVQVVSQRADGEFVPINNMMAGDMFGEIALLTEESTRSATTMSNEGCELLLIDKLAFETHLLKVDILTQYIMSQFCKRIVRLTHMVRDQPPST